MTCPPSDSDKKLHQGWGGDDGPTEAAVEAQGAADAVAEVATNDWAGTPANDDGWGAPSADAAAPAAPEEGDANGDAKKGFRARDEEDENLKTLDEYLASQNTGLTELVPKLEGRKANDGADDDSLFKGAKKLAKGEEEDAYFVGKVRPSNSDPA